MLWEETETQQKKYNLSTLFFHNFLGRHHDDDLLVIDKQNNNCNNIRFPLKESLPTEWHSSQHFFYRLRLLQILIQVIQLQT